MGRRLDLHEILKSICPTVYWQAPEAAKMEYPCILYRLTGEEKRHADNRPFITTDQYQITLIDEDPDTELRGQISALPTSDFDRYFPADNLHHFVYNVFF